MADNGQHEERRKKCPFLNSWCIGDECELRTPIHVNTNVMGVHKIQQINVCSFVAMPMIMSNRPAAQPQKNVPPLFRG